MSSSNYLSNRVESALKSFDWAYDIGVKHFILAYSGGKDSTATAILLYEWLLSRKVDVKVTVIHNDTLSEIVDVEDWVRSFVDNYVNKLCGLGIDAHAIYLAPKAIDTWYWRVIVRGYSAPNFKYRWCVDLLKIFPLKSFLSIKFENYIVVVGLRENESTYRVQSVPNRFGSCALNQSCAGYYIAMNNDIPKLAPIRNWDLVEVWAYLTTQKHFNVEPLINLYSVNPRFGCWHCTLASHRVRRTTNPYYDAVRLLYRSVTDLLEFRAIDAKRHKATAINEYGRYVILRSLELAEKLSGKRLFYGLDYAKVKSYSQTYTLRELFYELPCKDADRAIRIVDDSYRFMSMCQIRNAKPNGDMLRKLSWWSRSLVNNLPDSDPIVEALNNILNNL